MSSLELRERRFGDVVVISPVGRLVPDQDPDQIAKLFKAHVKRVAPKGVKVEVTYIHGGKPWKAELEGPLYDAARRALTTARGPACPTPMARRALR